MGFSVLTAREMKQEPIFARSLALVPRSLFLNRTETLATQASSGAPPKGIMSVYSAFIRPVFECTCLVWHFSIPQHLNDQIEQIQRRALRIALPHMSYSDGLEAMTYKHLTNVEKITAINFIRTFLSRKVIN